MQFHDGLYEGQTESSAWLMPRGIDTIKPIKDLGQMFRRDAASSVFHPDFRAIPLKFPDGNHDSSARRSMAEAVIQQIAQRAPK